MDPAKRLGSGPLTAAAISLTPAAEGVDAIHADAAVTLAGLMDLRGSVEIARRLPGKIRAIPRQIGGAGDGRIAARVDEEIARVKASTERRFADAFGRRGKIPSADLVLEALEQTGSLADRGGRSLTAAAARIWAPFRDLTAGSVARIGAEVRAIREAIARLLRDRGSELEQLDAALRTATAGGRARIVEALIDGLGAGFSRHLEAEVKALPPTVTQSDLEPWLRGGGILRREAARCEAVALGILAHERGLLLALAEEADAIGPPRRAAAPTEIARIP